MSERLDQYTIELDRSDLGRIVNSAFKDTGNDERWFLFFGDEAKAISQGIMTISEARKIAEGQASVKYFSDENNIKYQEVAYHVVGALDLVRKRLEGFSNLSILVKEDDEKLGVQIMIDGTPQF